MSENGIVDDGFDLLEYPCAYTFKAMCRNKPSAILAVKTVFSVRSGGASLDQIIFNITPSGKGTYVSVSALVTLQNRQELEGIYQRLYQHDQVLMTL